MTRRALVLSLLAACGHSSSTAHPDAAAALADAGPSATECLRTQDGGPGCFAIDMTIQAVQFETMAAPEGTVTADIFAAWQSSGDPFPASGQPLASVQLLAANGFVGSVGTCVGSFVVAAITRGGGTLAKSVNDKRVDCTIGSAAAPYPIYVLSAATVQSWATEPVLLGYNFGGNDGLVVVTYRDPAHQPAAGVQPVIMGQGAPPILYLAADRRTIEPRTGTSASGTIVLPLAGGKQLRLTGTGAAGKFETVSVSTVAGGVFFEQIDSTP